MDGHMVLTNRLKFAPEIKGQSYRGCTAAEYHSRETKAHECRVGCRSTFVEGARMEKTWTSISGGKSSDRRLVSRFISGVPGSSILRSDVLRMFMISMACGISQRANLRIESQDSMSKIRFSVSYSTRRAAGYLIVVHSLPCNVVH